MFAIIITLFILISFWTLIYFYILTRLSGFLEKKLNFTKTFLYTFIFSILIFLIIILNEKSLSRFLFYSNQIVNYFLGIIFILFPIMLSAEVFFGISWILKYFSFSKMNLFLKEKKKEIAFGILFLTGFFYIYGIWKFESGIYIKRIIIRSDKIKRSYKILHLSDLQFGSVGILHVKKVRKKVLKLHLEEGPIDLIANTGDQIDSANYLNSDLNLLEFKEIPTFFSLGNHEFYHGLNRILKLLSERRFIILRNRNQFYKELNLIGIDDSRDKQQLKRVFEKTPHLINKNRFNLLLYHRPTGVEDAKKLGIDLMLCGHTHGGQIPPYSWMLNWFFDYSQGINQIGDFILYVTDGVGIWGPKIRIGTKNEMTLITLLPRI